MVGDKSGGPEKFLERIAKVAAGETEFCRPAKAGRCDVHLLDELGHHRHALFIFGGTRREDVRVIRDDVRQPRYPR